MCNPLCGFDEYYENKIKMYFDFTRQLFSVKRVYRVFPSNFGQKWNLGKKNLSNEFECPTFSFNAEHL